MSLNYGEFPHSQRYECETLQGFLLNRSLIEIIENFLTPTGFKQEQLDSNSFYQSTNS